VPSRVLPQPDGEDEPRVPSPAADRAHAWEGVPRPCLKSDLIIVTVSFTRWDAAATSHAERAVAGHRGADRLGLGSVLRSLRSCSENPTLMCSLVFSSNYPQDLRGTLRKYGCFHCFLSLELLQNTQQLPNKPDTALPKALYSSFPGWIKVGPWTF